MPQSSGHSNCNLSFNFPFRYMERQTLYSAISSVLLSQWRPQKLWKSMIEPGQVRQQSYSAHHQYARLTHITSLPNLSPLVYSSFTLLNRSMSFIYATFSQGAQLSAFYLVLSAGTLSVSSLATWQHLRQFQCCPVYD